MSKLTFAGDKPIVISYDGDTQDIYNPIKKSSAILRVVDASILSDLYTQEKDGIKVEIKKTPASGGTKQTLWSGFVTPNAYSQDLSANLDDIDIECIDVIGLLRYVNMKEVFFPTESVAIQDAIFYIFDYINSKSELSLKVYYDPIIRNEYRGYNVQMKNYIDKETECNCEQFLSSVLRLFNLSIYCYDNIVYIVDFSKMDEYTELLELKQHNVTISSSMHKPYSIPTKSWKVANSDAQMSIDDSYTEFSVIASTHQADYDIDIEEQVDKHSTDFNIAGNYLNVDKFADYSQYYRDEKKIQSNVLLNAYWVGNQFYFNLNTTNPSYPATGRPNYVNMGGYAYMVGDAAQRSLANYAYGSVFNYYGTETNGIDVIKEGTTYKPAYREVKESTIPMKSCITTFAPDNGLAVEYATDNNDLKWNIRVKPVSIYESTINYPLAYWNGNSSKFGNTGTSPISSFPVERLRYEQVPKTILENSKLKIDIEYWYSRTGFAKPFEFKYDRLDSNEDYYEGQTLYAYPSDWANISINNDTVASQANMHTFTDEIEVEIKYSNSETWEVSYFNGEKWVSYPTAITLKVDRKGKNMFYDHYKPKYLVTGNGTQIALSKTNTTHYENIEIDDEGVFSITPPYGAESGDITVTVMSPKALGETPALYTLDIDDENNPQFYKFTGFPKNITHHKAAHFSNNITFEVKKGSLEQIYGEKDVRYDYKLNRPYSEKYPQVNLMTNTYNPIVLSSFSYVWDADIDYNKLWDERPEISILRKLAAYYGKVRKVFSQSIRYTGSFDRFAFIRVPYLSNNKFMVLRTDWDVKRNVNMIETTEYDLTDISDGVMSDFEVDHMDRDFIKQQSQTKSY